MAKVDLGLYKNRAKFGAYWGASALSSYNTQVVQEHRCKEIISSTFNSRIWNCAVNSYGCEYDFNDLGNDQHDIDHTRLSVGASKSVELVAYSNHIRKLLRPIEKKLGLTPTKVFYTDKANTIVVVGDKIWMSATWKMCLYLYYIKTPHIKMEDEFLNKLPLAERRVLPQTTISLDFSNVTSDPSQREYEDILQFKLNKKETIEDRLLSLVTSTHLKETDYRISRVDGSYKNTQQLSTAGGFVSIVKGFNKLMQMQMFSPEEILVIQKGVKNAM